MDQDIAIIGLSCRVPGAVNYKAFWAALLAGRIALGPWPSSRQAVSGIWSRDATFRTSRLDRAMFGGYLDDVDLFDAGLFGISAREASAIDPQHRLMLEASWLALQDAVIDPRRLSGSHIGVYVGLTSPDYAMLSHEAGANTSAYAGLGASNSLGANRISHALGLQGPSFSIDSACSSSLVAVHLARQALLAGECETALVASCNLILTPTINTAFFRARMLSPTGRCVPFRANADGYLRSEGAAAIILKRLPEAIRDQDHVYALIKATAVNQDGRTPGITVPSESAQVDVIHRAWAQAGIGADDVDFLEAHGTGTPVGDRAELAALSSIFSKRSADRAPCLIGSLKANVGHTEAAAGLLSLIKSVGVLHHGEVPPHAGEGELVTIPTKALGRMTFPDRATYLTDTNRSKMLCAAVSAFGFGGTNAHAVLQQAPFRPRDPQFEKRPVLLSLSAHTPESLNRMTERWIDWLETLTDDDLPDAGITSNCAHASEVLRLWALADTATGAAEQLKTRLAAAHHPTSQHNRRPIALLLGAATGLSDGALDLLGPTESRGVRQLQLDRGTAAADLATQVHLAALLGPVLRKVPAVTCGAHPLVAALWHGKLDSPVVSQMLNEAVSPSENVTRCDEIDSAAEILLREAGQIVVLGCIPETLFCHGPENIGHMQQLVYLTADRAVTLNVVGQLWARGEFVALNELPAESARRVCGAPEYAFDRQPYWLSHIPRPAEVDSVISPGGTAIQLDFERMDYLRQHCIDGLIVVPGATLIDLAMCHASSLFGATTWDVTNVVFTTPVILDRALRSTVQLKICRCQQVDDDYVAFEYYHTEIDDETIGRSGSASLASGTLRPTTLGVEK